MNADETKRTIDFILEQQAQITVTMGRVTETVDRLSVEVDRVTETVERLSVKVDRNTEGIAGLLAAAEIQAAEIRDLTRSIHTLADRQREAKEWQREADERGRRTDERLNALINIVERHISGGRNGKAQE